MSMLAYERGRIVNKRTGMKVVPTLGDVIDVHPLCVRNIMIYLEDLGLNLQLKPGQHNSYDVVRRVPVKSKK